MKIIIDDNELKKLIENAYISGACRTPFMNKTADNIKISELYNDFMFTSSAEVKN